MSKPPILAAFVFLISTSALLDDDQSLDGLKDRIVGNWKSISFEIRPTANPENRNLSPTPTYLTRDFTYDADGGFQAVITIYADPGCSTSLVTYDFAGELAWHNANPAALGAWSQDYILNKKLEITVLARPMADQLNALPAGACGNGVFEVNVAKDILGQPCTLLRFVEGSDFVVDHDFLYVREDTPNMLFMGGKHVDGTGFYYPENRPIVGLQQPLIRTE